MDKTKKLLEELGLKDSANQDDNGKLTFKYSSVNEKEKN